MSLTEIWTRNPFDVEAVQVTEANIYDVAQWCRGTTAISIQHYPKKYVRLEATHYNKQKVVKVFVGDWVILVQNQFKHYRDGSLRLAYHKKDQNPRQTVLELFQQALTSDIDAGDCDYTELSEAFTDRVMAIIEGRVEA